MFYKLKKQLVPNEEDITVTSNKLNKADPISLTKPFTNTSNTSS